jgi:hypothetical protein
MQHLLEILERNFTLVCAVRGSRDSFDLYYWKFERLEIGNLPDAAALSWIGKELGQLGCSGRLLRTIATEVQRLCRGNPGLISRTLKMMKGSGVSLDDPIRVRRFFIDGQLSELKDRWMRTGR